MKKIIVICGPTATGKTKYSIEIANKYNGEIVSCDSMQIYKYMNIGSTKPTKKELTLAKHHLIDIIDPREEFSVALYSELARNTISDILNRNKLPIVCGGTGLYLNSILYNMDFSNKSKNPKLRNDLEILSNEELYSKLLKINKDSAERIHPNNRKKLIRAIECLGLDDFSLLNQKNNDIDPVLICLLRDREELYQRINSRVEQMVDEGIFEEVKHLIEMGLSYDDISMKGIGYKEIIEYYNGLISKDEAIDNIKKNTRHYAKRQITWFKRYDDMNFINISNYNDDNEVLNEIYKLI